MVKNNLHIVMALNNTKASEVAEKTGISKSTISKFINGKTDIKLSTLISLCIFFKCQLTDLIELTHED
ncbi:helix-turn-helix domain-containing protein [Streptococcus agalactiae]|nr:helix-turn-helix transcriptional regulator [Streptococcus agalactiae]KLK21534.1 Cro/Cl family transcriptional regulator [Streptococcus agalactiae]KLL22083.1 Cro/Cl family transcriptional regulator [Streptococcus agalactiae]CNB28351.1 Predicted transcriptional regulator [Streptococcus agalactiae]CNC04153.1 Predicted transcriptional regulator [Streptococcus agalactiae]CNE28209.1 Predicted transcriptional regulator [Streptococcus agalactiae]